MPESMSAGYIESTNQAKLITDPTAQRPQVRSQHHHVSCQAIYLLQFVPEHRARMLAEIMQIKKEVTKYMSDTSSELSSLNAYTNI